METEKNEDLAWLQYCLEDIIRKSFPERVKGWEVVERYSGKYVIRCGNEFPCGTDAADCHVMTFMLRSLYKFMEYDHRMATEKA